MIVVVWFQYEICYFTRSFICTVSFNLINTFLFTDDVELVNLNNFEVLILQGNELSVTVFRPIKQLIKFR